MIGLSVCSDFDTTITFAVDQIGDAFQPNHTQKTNAHHNNWYQGNHISQPGHTYSYWKYAKIGSIATVIGILSTSADNTAETQRITRAVTNMFDSAPEVINLANDSSTHACSRPQTIINSDQKNNNTDSSSFSNIFWGSFVAATSIKASEAQMIATIDGSIHILLWTKKSSTTKINTHTIFLSTTGSVIALFSSIFIKSSIAFLSGFSFNSFLKTNFNVSRVANHATNTIGNEWIKKSLKLNHAADHIIILGGSHTRVATPHVSDNSASAINIGIALILSILAIIIVIGTISIIVVTLSNISDNKVVRVQSARVNFHKSHHVFFATFIQRYWKAHVCSNIATIIIIQNNNHKVLKSRTCFAISGVKNHWMLFAAFCISWWGIMNFHSEEMKVQAKTIINAHANHITALWILSWSIIVKVIINIIILVQKGIEDTTHSATDALSCIISCFYMLNI